MKCGLINTTQISQQCFKNFHCSLAATFSSSKIDYASVPSQGGDGRIAFYPETKTSKVPQNQT